jgi:CHAT domain-containing protein/Flp pilus assembly protein TadD
MKYRLLFILLFLANLLAAQSVDSLAIKQVDSLIQVSRDLTAKRDFDQALEVNAAAEQLALEKLGRESAAYGSCAFNRGRVNYINRDYPEAEIWYLQSQTIRKKVLGKTHPDYAWCLNNLGLLYEKMGNNEKAEPLYLEAKSIREKALGKEHPVYAGSLNNLASFYWNMGNLEKAEPLYLEAIAIREKVLGKEHPDYAGSLNGLGTLYWITGNYEKAEPLYLEAKDIRKKVLGVEHPDYAGSQINLGIFYRDMGKYEKAELLYLEAKNIFEGNKNLQEHPFYMKCLNNLAVLYSDMGNYEKAEPLYLEAKAIREKALGKEHLNYVGCLINLGLLYSDMGNYQKAEPLLLEAKTVFEGNEKLQEHPFYVNCLNNLAVLYQYMGNYEKAERLHLEARSIRESVQGKEHPDYATSLNNLANLYERQSRSLEAELLLLEALTRSQNRLVKATSFLSEQELSKYAVTFQNSGDKLSAYLLARQAGAAQYGILPALAYDHALFYKGFLLTAASRLNSPALASPESVEINLQLKGYRRRLAAEYTKPITERKGIPDLEEKANLAEKELARTVAGYADALKQVKWEDVKAGLKQAEAAIEFVHFKVTFPSITDSTMYGALLILPGAEQPKFIPLFEEKEFDHFLAADKERKSDYVNDLYAWADRGMVQLGSAKKSLYDLIWSKIEAAGLEGIKTVYYSPSGVLHRLNLGAIAVDDETILSDRYNLVAMNSTRQLVIPPTVTIQANDALLLGGVNFEVDTVNTTYKELPLLAGRSAADAWTESGSCGGSWSYLKWTEKEVERIGSSLSTSGFDVTKLSDKEASEEEIKSIGFQGPSPRVLHLATHGFFFPDPEQAPAFRRGLGEAEPVFKSSDNPMIRSGLILAGGNYAWQHGKAVSPEKEDGILTAYEISQMNLSNTELVVLSACETGLGDIQGNEGVYGLQRAFKIAGAKYLIMSLWQVPDRETMEFMTTFYGNWLEESMTIPDAFRKTQREMRDRFFNPYSWAGFVLVE